MRARHIRQIRLRLANPMLLMIELVKWAERERENESFKTFYCSPFFEGSTLAEINFKKYNKENSLIQRKITMYRRLINNLEDNK